MAASTVPGVPFINLSDAMRAFYARRGMWANGAPRGMLALWLGEQLPQHCNYYVSFWTTHEGLQAMSADACAAPPQAWTNHHQRAQFLRRVREAGERAGVPAYMQRQTNRMPRGQVPPAAPFAELSVPPVGTKTREAFERHVMKTLREFVEYSQGSAYTG